MAANPDGVRAEADVRQKTSVSRISPWPRQTQAWVWIGRRDDPTVRLHML
jgi:hypothetical protein